ncbi:MAG: hypothetical protein WA820_22410 [Bradyrhizobium sp.]|jgi:hypothetical protein
MRTLCAGALAAMLVGCSCYVSPQVGFEACTGTDGSWFACSERTAINQTIEIEPTSSAASPATAKFKSRIAKTAKPAVHPHNKIALKTAASSVAPAKVEPTTPAQPAETPDPVIAKAKITIAAKLPDPASAEFGEMKRAMRRNTLGQSVDTICGRVKAGKASNEAADRPFLYLVKDDEAYVVDGPPGSAAATAYRNICP